MAGGGGAPSVDELEACRGALRGYCYRMLGSPFDAEDAVQETFARAWRSRETFAGRAALSSWLHRIATHVCFDQLDGRRRRALPVELSPATADDDAFGPLLPPGSWVEPAPDAWADPAEAAARRDTVRLAFVAALQALAPRPRAVLVLRDVLRWRSAEVAALLDTTTTAVDSMLRRARATLAEEGVSAGGPAAPLDAAQRRLLDRYVTAFERHDVATLVSLLHEDATMTMPPFEWLLAGRDAIARSLAATEDCAGSVLLPTSANGRPAFGQYRPDDAADEVDDAGDADEARGDGVAHAFGLVVVDVVGDRITAMTTFLDPRLLALCGLPATTSAGDRGRTPA